METTKIFCIWLICIGATFHVVHSARDSRIKSFRDYSRVRKELINSEFESSFGADIKLNTNEQMANKIIMQAKESEFQAGFLEPQLFNPSRHIFDVLDAIKQSKLFQIIQKMPKGGLLHAHAIALCSTEYLVSLTYLPNLWQRTPNKNRNEILEFVFSRKQPKITNPKHKDSTWRLVKDVRAKIGKNKYDEKIGKLFTLIDKSVDPRVQFNDDNVVCDRTGNIFDIFRPIATYEPVWKAYFKQALKEMLEDNVQYLELRTSFPKVYDLDGKIYNKEDNMKMYIETLNEFKRENPTFIDAKFIYAEFKLLPNQTGAYFDNVQQLRAKFPEYLVGFDLVGQENTTPGLDKYAEKMLQLPDDIKLFFHAGETSWFGSIDENLIDAVLMGSHRIGHGYALAKHPKVIELIKHNDIAVEVNPISNQVLKLVDDYRNHPASVLMAQNVPIVVSSDDPSFWGVSPLSHDFYITFLGIASRHADLRILKKLAINSIQYSALNDVEKKAAFAKWQIKWVTFINDLVRNKK